MALETLGVFKAAVALKGAAVGLAAAVPPLITNSATATHQLVMVATPILAKTATASAIGLATVGAGLLKGAAALKAGAASLFAGKAATGAAAASAGAKAATGASTAKAAAAVAAAIPPVVQ